MNDTRNNSPPPPYSVTESSVPAVNPTFNTKVQPNLNDSNYPPFPQFNSNASLPYQSSNLPNNVTSQPAAQTISARTASFGPFPVEMDCPYCQVIS